MINFGKKKKKTGGWRAAAARRLEEAKASATKFAEGVGDKAAEVQQYFTLNELKARTSLGSAVELGKVTARQCFTECDLNHDGTVSKSEMIRALRRHPVLAQDLGLKTGALQRDLIENGLVQLMMLWGGAFAVTGRRSEGLVSALLYFGYMFIAALVFFVLTGTVGFLACWCFVRVIYGAVKVE